MKKFRLLLFALLFIFLATGTAGAALIEFVPPNDPVGQVWSTNANDGYSSGRGMVFQMLEDVTIYSLGIYHDLTNIDLSYEIAQTIATTGNVTAGQTILASGNSTVTTNGLQWIDFTFAPLTLYQGNSYHFEFTHLGSGNQNFFYTQSGFPNFAQNDFELIDGTCGGDTGNYVIAGFRVNTTASAVPEPATMLLLGSGLVGLVGLRRKLKRR